MIWTKNASQDKYDFKGGKETDRNVADMDLEDTSSLTIDCGPYPMNS